MNKDDLFTLIQNFSERPLPATFGRHVYLWHGGVNVLRAKIPHQIFELLDLHHLVSELPRTPYSREEASRLLRKAIQNHIYSYTTFNRQRIIAIVGCDLLNRYRVPLIDFFSLASEALMFIFVVLPEETNFRPTSPLPDFVSLNPTSTFNYLRGAIGEPTTIDLTEG